MSLLKIPFILLNTLSSYASLTSPQPRVSQDERPKEVDLNERIFSTVVQVYTTSFKLFVCSGGALETAVILASNYPSHPLSQKILSLLVRGPLSLTSRIGVSPLFLAGFTITIVGGYIRYQCYRTLGRFFTYEVTIRDDHKLITSGPYAYVRHPSYTSAIASCIGMGMCYASPGGWMTECRILETLAGKAAMWLYVAFVIYGCASVVARIPLEDSLLKKRFGQQWDAWAKKVPYRMIPYIFWFVQSLTTAAGICMRRQ